MSKSAEKFVKYTVQPRGLFGLINRIFAIDSNRSTGIPLNPQFRYPAPGAQDPTSYTDAVTLPAADLADNPYWKRDVRRNYPQLSTVTQADVAGLLTVGSRASPVPGALKSGADGDRQLVEIATSGRTGGVAAIFESPTGPTSLASVLNSEGLPPVPTPMSGHPTVVQYHVQPESEQSYGAAYPCRSFK